MFQKSFLLVSLTLCIMASLSACGKKGPLYHPDHSAHHGQEKR